MVKRIVGAWALPALLALVCGAAVAAPEVEVQGLFAGRAILEIDGDSRLVKAGERTDEGVLLVSSNSKEAVIEVGGVRRTLGLTGQIASGFTDSRVAEVRISQSPDSHFRVQGSINGKTVTMMVDTGATAVAMNTTDARRLGIDYEKGMRGKASTAGGLVDSYGVELNRVSVGQIEVHNILGVVIDGDFPSQILLGNSFLSHVNMQQEAGALILKSRY